MFQNITVFTVFYHRNATLDFFQNLLTLKFVHKGLIEDICSLI